uniref:Conserved oligomeric Golgi complex subunit 3 N-terminal domain-containing protein n=1 Tax=Neovison vison TaxID=452646 RepID=A0A8C7A8J0_NEOVI
MAEAALLLPPEAAAERDAREKLALWDRRPDTTAPLTDRQMDSVLELKAAAENLPIPFELPVEDMCSITSQSLSVAQTLVVPESTEDILSKGFTSLEMEEERIETAQQFFSWFAKLQTQMEQDEGTKYRQMRDYLSGFQEQCDAILNDVNSALQHLESLQKQYLFVSNKTGTLHEACEQLLKEQSELVDLAENIQQKLSYFNELETINTKLNSPTLSVNSEGFIPMLAKLDDCITYISSHPNFKDYPVYLLKFKQCLSKALHLMKTYTVNILQNLTNQLLKRDPASIPSADNAFTLFYVKFRAAAPKVRYRSFTSLFRFIPRYLTVYGTVASWIDSLISFSAVSLLVYKNATDFCTLILHSAALLNSCIPRNFLAIFWVFYVGYHVVCR